MRSLEAGQIGDSEIHEEWEVVKDWDAPIDYILVRRLTIQSTIVSKSNWFIGRSITTDSVEALIDKKVNSILLQRSLNKSK